MSVRRYSNRLTLKLIAMVAILVLLSAGSNVYTLYVFSKTGRHYQEVITTTAKANQLLSNIRVIVDQDLYAAIGHVDDPQHRSLFIAQLKDVQNGISALIERVTLAEEQQQLRGIERIIDSFIQTSFAATDPSRSARQQLSSYEDATRIFTILEKNMSQFVHFQVAHMAQVAEKLSRTTSSITFWLYNLLLITLALALVGGVAFSRKVSEKVFSDLSAHQQEAQEAHRLATTDALTGLRNRLYLERRMEAEQNKSPVPYFAFMLIDLDNFKTINDRYGHESGDELLKVISDRLIHCTRHGDLVARLGGDEFVAVIMGADFLIVKLIAERIVKSLAEPVIYQGAILKVSASVGIAQFPQDGLDFSTIYRVADKAMYEAKERGKNTFVMR